MALLRHRKAIREILDQISPLIIGQTLDINLVSCGHMGCRTATAIDIIPAGDEYPGQEIFWYLWQVVLKCEHRHESRTIKTRLSEFVSEDVLSEIFDRYFTDADILDRPYEQPIDEEERLDRKLKPAVRIKDNSGSTRFYIAWGRSQTIARIVEIINDFAPNTIYNNTFLFWLLVLMLSVLRPETYVGGPVPEMRHESNWLTNYKQALKMSKKSKYLVINRIMRGTHLGIYDADISFVK